MTITIDSNFVGGGLGSIKFGVENNIYFSAPLDGSPLSLWFYFRIRNAKGKQLRFHQVKLDTVLEFDTSEGVTPVTREGLTGEWKRLAPPAVNFCSNPRRFDFTLTPHTDETYVAFCYPYLYSDFLAFVDRTDQKGLVKKETLGQTAEGRDYPMFLFGDPKPGKKLVVCTARQHAGEVSGSFVLEGIIRRFLSSSEQQNNFVLAVFPFVDLDGVQEGRYGKLRPPIDFNVDWSIDPFHQEIKAIQEKIEALTEEFEYVFFADLHAPQPGAPSFLVPIRQSIIGNPAWEDFWSFGKKFAALTDRVSPCRLTDHQIETLNWGGSTYQANCTHYQWARYGVASTILETAYNRDSYGNLLTPNNWRTMGEHFINSVYQHYVLGNKIPIQQEEIPPNSVGLAGWETLSIPMNIVADGKPGTLTVESLGETKGSFWFGHATNSSVKKGTKSAIFDLNYTGSKPLQLNLLIYYLKDKVVFSRVGQRYLLLMPGENQYEIFLDDLPEGTSHIKLTFQGIEIEGKLTITVI